MRPPPPPIPVERWWLGHVLPDPTLTCFARALSSSSTCRFSSAYLKIASIFGASFGSTQLARRRRGRGEGSEMLLLLVKPRLSRYHRLRMLMWRVNWSRPRSSRLGKIVRQAPPPPPPPPTRKEMMRDVENAPSTYRGAIWSTNAMRVFTEGVTLSMSNSCLHVNIQLARPVRGRVVIDSSGCVHS